VQRWTIHVSDLWPERGPFGCGPPVALRFRYDADLVDVLKDALWHARGRHGPKVGGWIADMKVWYVERSAWPAVRSELADAGCAFREDPSVREPGPEPSARARPPVDWPAVLRQWQRELALQWHPDRGGDVKVMQALNDAADRLKQLIGV
jgi:hypothetical protein